MDVFVRFDPVTALEFYYINTSSNYYHYNYNCNYFILCMFFFIYYLSAFFQYNDLRKKKRIVENDKAKILETIEELDQKKNEALNVAWQKVKYQPMTH